MDLLGNSLSAVPGGEVASDYDEAIVIHEVFEGELTQTLLAPSNNYNLTTDNEHHCFRAEGECNMPYHSHV